jgi:cobalamin synthase
MSWPGDEWGNSTGEEVPPMRLTTIAHYVLPFVALISGASILLIPRLLNYVVAAYLVLVGLIGLNGIFHLVR